MRSVDLAAPATYAAAKRASAAYHAARAVLLGSDGPLATWVTSASLGLALDDFGPPSPPPPPAPARAP